MFFDNISKLDKNALNNKIIFYSGTNGIVFPMKYLTFFENIISNNLFLKIINVTSY